MGTASGANQTLQRFGAVFAASGHLRSPTSFIAGFRAALLTTVGLSLLGSLSALAVGGRRRAAADEIQAEVEPELQQRRPDYRSRGSKSLLGSAS
jgi:hypothetical protein